MTPPAPPLNQIVVTPPSPDITVGSTQQFIATGVYQNGSTADLTNSVTWTSSNPAVATIAAGGLATAVSPGTVTISAKSGSITGSTDLTATIASLVSVAVNPLALTLAPTQTVQYAAFGTYDDNSLSDITGDVTWTSSDPSIASISASGLATAVVAGSTSIVATAGEITGSATLAVSGAVAPPIPGSPADYLLQAQKQLFLLVTGQATQSVETPQLGRVQYHPTTPGDLQRAITYLQGLVLNGNTWPTTPGSGGSMTAGFTYGRKPFSIYGMP